MSIGVIMRGACIAVLAMSSGGMSSALAGSPQKNLATIFTQICLEFLPDYVGADIALEARGFVLTPYGGKPLSEQGPPYGEGEFEFADPDSNLWGAMGVGADFAGCSVLDAAVSATQSENLAKLVLQNFSDAPIEVWHYNGEPSAWTVPYEARRLYVMFNAGGLSTDLRDE